MTAATAGRTAAAMVAFATNSLLCRAALGPGLVDAASFTGLRLASGAAVLALLVRREGSSREPHGGSWAAASALFAYAIAFSYAYDRIPASVGALVLFGAVQVTLVAWALAAGQRPRPVEWVGLAVAFCGFLVLTRPGLTAPDGLGVALMAAAGVCWGAYSVRGLVGTDPLRATAHNFARAVPFALLALLLAAGHLHASVRGLLLAAASGGLASALGYVVWYGALRGLRATQAAVVQLSVPVLAATGGILLLGESFTPRLAGSGAAILGGIALALQARRAGSPLSARSRGRSGARDA